MKHLNNTNTAFNVEKSALRLIVALINEQQEMGNLVQKVVENDSISLFSGLTPPDCCSQLNGVNTQQVNAWFVEKNILMKVERGHKVKGHARDKYLRQKCDKSKDGLPYYYSILTVKGAKYLYKAYLENRLPMKKDWDGLFTYIEC
ncbi:conserved hypothetical protein [Psychromonas ingrahamii 37]|uniref:Uncharacterized protein n=1 Tax=Psychromonas ingrahamii (strain DSM 17664 / CCUG 51855 / 37) TaxID=357804 RepID=A1SRZ8_PSYIN|nr:hypothetical protein [Psychromonas ingrahamii]ABM02263.1 conserved hypothetical protein [Psychromonas ingrahamii 37]